MAEFPLAPGSTIGILGGGQLGRMLALAAARLGFDVVIQDPEEASPAGRVAARQIVATYDDRWALKRLAEACDVVTYEFENVPADTVAELAALAGISPAHLRRAFKQSTGSTIGEHIRQVQFERARTLLADTDLRLNEIATRLGFSAPYGFTVAFQRSAGETPSAFRQRMRAGRGN